MVQEPILYPGEALRTLRDGFPRRVLVVRGRLRRSSRAYRSGYYHSLLGEEGESLTLLAPPALDARLPREDGQLVTVRGYLDFTLSEGRIQPLLQMTELIATEAAPAPDPRLPLYEGLARKERKDVPTLLRRALLSGERPRLLFLYPREGIVDHDVERALGAARAAFQIEERRVGFAPATLVGELEQADLKGYAAIAVVRGGGSGLSALDHPALVEAALALRTPLIAAIGHAKDSTLLAAAADWRVETPSLLGAALKELAAATPPPARPFPVWELWLYRLLALGAALWLLWRWLGSTTLTNP